MLRLLAFVLPLGVDSFAIAATLGAAAVSAKQRWRITAWFVLFEAGMPLLGLAVGAPLARAVGGVADYLAAAALVAVGLWMLLGGDEDAEEDKARQLLDARGLLVVGLGLSIFSYDGQLSVGLASDAELLPDPEHLIGLLDDELARVVG